MPAIRLALASVALLLVSTGSAWAYIDPGSASLLLQGLIGAAAALLVGLRLYWGRLKAAFRGSARSEGEDAGKDPAGPGAR